MALEFDASPDELQFFLLEAEEQLQTLDDGLLDLERGGAREDLLQDIFRAAHTLKGSSATIGHRRMAELTHHLEDVFDKLRQNKLDVSAALVDAGFEALDALRLLSAEVATLQHVDLDIAPILAGLARVQTCAGAATGKSVATATQVFDAHIVFEAGHPLMAARALQISLELAAGGRILEMSPERDAIEREDFGGELRVIVEWPEGQDHLEDLLARTPDTTSFAVKATTFEAAGHANLYRIAITFDERNELRAARAVQLLMRMQQEAGLLSTNPSFEEIEAEKLGTKLAIKLEWDAGLEDLDALLADNPDIVEYAIEELALAAVESTAGNEEQPPAGERTVGRRTPPATGNTIRVSVERIDKMLDLVGELVIERSRIADTARNLQAVDGSNPEIDRLIESTGQIEMLISQLHEELMLGRMLPIESVLGKFPRLVRDLAQSLSKDVDFELDSGEVELDRSVIEAISDPLIHIVRNAVDHGIESPEDRIGAGKPATGTVSITARQVENRIVVTVSDDGKGIDTNALRASAVEKGLLTEEAAARLTEPEAINLIFHSGFSTASEVTGVSGRGVGMDIVRKNLENIGGTVEISSKPGQGSVFTIRLPLTLAIIRALLVRSDRWTFAMPLDAVIETVRLSDIPIHMIGQRHAMKLRDRIIPVMHLSESLTHGRHADGEITDSGYAVVMNGAGNPVAVIVDSLVGEQEVVVKPLGAYIPPVPGISGATILGDGSFSLIVDISRLMTLEGAEHGAAFAA